MYSVDSLVFSCPSSGWGLAWGGGFCGLASGSGRGVLVCGRSPDLGGRCAWLVCSDLVYVRLSVCILR